VSAPDLRGSVAFSPDGEQAVWFAGNARWHDDGSSDDPNAARLQHLAVGSPPPRVLQAKGHARQASFSPDSRFVLTVVGNWDKPAEGSEVRAWNAATGEPVGPGIPIRPRPEIVSFMPDGRGVFIQINTEDPGQVKTTVQVWDPFMGKPTTPLVQLDAEGNDVAPTDIVLSTAAH
jgi:WD40 repeat protein